MSQFTQITGTELKSLIEETCARLSELDIIYRRSTRLVLRRPWVDGKSVIVKLWARPDLPGTIRRYLRISAPCYEWRSLKRVQALGIPVPEPIGFGNIGRNPTGYNEALVMEDLGPTQHAADRLVDLIAAGNEQAVHTLEEAVLRMTVLMVRARIIDYDHSMVNIVVDAAGDPYRLDLEQARKVPAVFLYRGRYVRMLGQLIGSYVFAVQPDIARAERFAGRIFEELRPTRSMIGDIQRHVDDMMHTQFQYNGMRTTVALPV